MHLKHRKTCRSCGSPALTETYDLGAQYLQGSFVRAGKECPPMRKVPLRLLRCDPTRDENACGLLQLAHSTPSEILYGAYWYRSGTNRTMTDHLTGIAEEAASVVAQDSARVLDIGCNDGTLLKAYPNTFMKFGVDPSDVARTVSDDVTVVQDLFPSARLDRETEGHPFDIITSIAMFYDLEDPIGFASSVGAQLANDGVWVIEMSYMPTMLELNSYDTICHEHLEYYSLSVIEFIMRAAGLKVVKASLNASNGGSIRCFITHAEREWQSTEEDFETLRRLRQTEFELCLDTDEPYRAFQKRAEASRDGLKKFVADIKAQGKSIHVYGASTKGNTILQYCDFDSNLIDCAADRNPEKHGASTLGTNIPIVSEEESRAMNPDYYLVLPWHFKEEFLERERAAIERGVGLIFPLPNLEVVTREHLARLAG